RARRSRLILIVDDEPAIRMLFEVVLLRHGHAVKSASTLAEARAICATTNPDIAIVDMFMPDGSGVDLIAALRRTCPAAGIIAITGGGTWERFDVLANAKAAGADITLRKPVTSDGIVEAVEALLARVE